MWVAFTLLSGCAGVPMQPGAFRTALAQTPFVQRSLANAWISVPDAELVLERSVGPIVEQRILLPNVTALPGDNVVLLRAHGASLAANGRFEPAKLLQSINAEIYPFDPIGDLTFFSRDDRLGALNWAEWTDNAGLTCVLVLRRLDAASRIVPAHQAVLDMVLRNCVHGTADEALLPGLPPQAGFAAQPGRPGGAPEMLSPLAGPLP